MRSMGIVVFWLNADQPHHSHFTDLQLTEALSCCQRLRRQPGITHVTLSSEHPNSVGQPGVDAVEDGRTPDGHVYDWTKRR